MEPTSIDVLASALEGSAPPDFGELSSPDGAVTLLFCEIANIAAIRGASAPESVRGMAIAASNTAPVTFSLGGVSGTQTLSLAVGN